MEERKNIRDRLNDYKLSFVWLINQLSIRGISTDKTEMSSIISGTRNGEKVDKIVQISNEILSEYEQNFVNGEHS